MKLTIISDEKRRLKMAVSGEGHTLLNLLQQFLVSNDNVEIAGYSKPHPLMDRSMLFVNMKGRKTWKKALLDASKEAKKELNEFLTKFESQVKKLNE